MSGSEFLQAAENSKLLTFLSRGFIIAAITVIGWWVQDMRTTVQDLEVRFVKVETRLAVHETRLGIGDSRHESQGRKIQRLEDRQLDRPYYRSPPLAGGNP